METRFDYLEIVVTGGVFGEAAVHKIKIMKTISYTPSILYSLCRCREPFMV
jgi:hypothetical protein